MIKETERFDAVSHDGQPHIIQCLKHYQRTTRPNGATEYEETLSEYVTAAGLSLNCIDPDTFQIAHTHQVVKKV